MLILLSDMLAYREISAAMQAVTDAEEFDEAEFLRLEAILDGLEQRIRATLPDSPAGLLDKLAFIGQLATAAPEATLSASWIESLRQDVLHVTDARHPHDLRSVIPT